MIRTTWFPVHIKPTRQGIYERSYQCGIRFAYWNGEYWGGFASDVKSAFGNRNSITAHHDAAWRGLPRKP